LVLLPDRDEIDPTLLTADLAAEISIVESVSARVCAPAPRQGREGIFLDNHTGNFYYRLR
jgi:hypothetical protein